MMNRRGEAAERFAERRRKEDESPRLSEVAPDLLSCRIEITERRADATTAEVSHTRHLVVARAPSVLFIACSDSSCKEGGHEIGGELLRGFRSRTADIRGEDTCNGDVGTVHCGRILTFAAHAEYRSPK